jgi:transposase
VIDFHTYHYIHDLYHGQHLPCTEIAHKLGLNPKTVSKWAQRERYAPRRQVENSSLLELDAYKKAILEEVAFDGCTVKAMFRRLREQGYGGGYTTVNQFVRRLRMPPSDSTIALPCRWMLRLLQGKVGPRQLVRDFGGKLSSVDAEALFERICEGRLRDRNRAIAVLADMRRISVQVIARFLIEDTRTVSRNIRKYRQDGIAGLFCARKSGPRKDQQPEYRDALFSILHSPPRDHGINRTSWRMLDLGRVMAERDLPINKDSIRRIIKDAGYRFKKAKKVLTSTDPAYRERLEAITGILSTLSHSERFFSVDEFGPVSIRMRGGRALTGPGEERIVPQRQGSKGTLIVVGALELSSNQMTHFYAEHKRTAEMIKLLHVLLQQYRDQERLFLSWDAASWHASKTFLAEVAQVNCSDYRIGNKSPAVVLAPLPACAQYLNVIESVFSGMARAIIHNSDYESVAECMDAIDLYYSERNRHFKSHPKRAGHKIWGQEREPPVFSESNNCKDPRYR